MLLEPYSDKNKYYCFIPIEEERLSSRRDYYFELLKGDIKLKDIQEKEKAILSENECFYHEGDNGFLERQVADTMIELIELMALSKTKSDYPRQNTL